MQTSGDRKPETDESYFAGVSEPPFVHGCDSSQAENALERRDLRAQSSFRCSSQTTAMAHRHLGIHLLHRYNHGVSPKAQHQSLAFGIQMCMITPASFCNHKSPPLLLPNA